MFREKRGAQLERSHRPVGRSTSSTGWRVPVSDSTGRARRQPTSGRGGPRWLRGHPRGSSTGVSAAGAARGRLRPCTVPVPSEHPALQWMGKCRPWPRSPFSTHKRSPEIIKEFRGTTTENLAREKDFFFFFQPGDACLTQKRGLKGWLHASSFPPPLC